MVTHLRRNAVAYLALFVALSGTSYAAVQISANSIGSKQLRKGAVTKAKIAPGAVTQLALAKGSVTQAALAAGLSLAGPQGAKGDSGAQGLKGDMGATGPAGPTFAKTQLVFTGAVPSATTDLTWGTMNVETTAEGRLFVFGRGNFSVTCASASPVSHGLYVDGVAATASGYTTASGTAAEVSLFGLTGVLAPGTHVLTLASDCTTPGVTYNGGSGGGDAALGAIFVGS